MFVLQFVVVVVVVVFVGQPYTLVMVYSQKAFAFHFLGKNMQLSPGLNGYTATHASTTHRLV